MMAKLTTRRPTLNEFDHDSRNMDRPPPPVEVDIITASRTNTTAITNSKTDADRTTTRKQAPKAARTKYYIDELGFYRYLDRDQQQYVCSNLNSVKGANGIGNSENESPIKILRSGDGGYEINFYSLRNDLGISHFDRTDDHKRWKKSWDDFMRAKLLRREPVTLNSELKRLVRSGIPHDYRCKVWTALIRMRTKSIRAAIGENIYEILLRDYARKVNIPEYKTDGDYDDNDDDNANANAAANATDDDDDDDDDENNNDSMAERTKTANQNGRPPNRPNRSLCSPARSGTATTTTTAATAVASGSPPKRQINNTNIPEPFIETCFKQIELDLLRTLPNNRHFEDPNSRGIHRVRNVLRAYACFNPTVGYCQGMNRLAAIALLVLPEEEAFWCLVAIIQCIMPKDYYLKPWLAQVDCRILLELLEKRMPKLHRHLARNDIELTCIFAWFFTIFADGFRPELMFRIWDCFLLEGDRVLFRMALSILHITHDELLELHDLSAMSAHLNFLISTRKLDMEQLFKTFESMDPFTSGLLQSRRDYHRNKMRAQFDADCWTSAKTPSGPKTTTTTRRRQTTG